jgi:hypothetical protein
VVFGAGLRLAYQVGRPFMRDEVGSLLYIARDYGTLLTHFDTWNTMNYYLVLAKALGDATSQYSWALVAPSLVAGTAAIPAIAALALRLTSSRTALLAAFFTAVNPFLVFYSVQIRSYMLLVLFCVGALVFFLDWAGSRGWRMGVACAVCSGLALLSHPNALYALAFVGVWFVLEARRSREGLASLVAPAAVSAAVVAFAYLPLVEPMREFRPQWSDAPPTSWNYLPDLARHYFAGGAAAIPSLLLLALGLWSASQTNHRLALLALGIAVPMGVASMLGVSVYPWDFARFLIPVLPPCLILMAEGAVHLARGRPVLAPVLGLLLAASWTPSFAESLAKRRDYPYLEVADHVQELRPGAGELLAIGNATWLHLRPYFDDRQFASAGTLVDGRPSGETERLTVVATDLPLRTNAPQQQFGRVQVVTYTAESRAQIGRVLLDDLRRTLGRRVSAELTNHYRTLLDLAIALSLDNVRVAYTELYWKCHLRRRWVRYAPRQILKLAPGER